IFVDDGYSGALLERPALNRLLGLARSRSITAIFVSDADRLSREPGHDWMIREDLKRFNVTLFVNGQAIDASPEGEVKDGMLAVFAKYERLKVVERMRIGKLRRAGLHKDVGQPLRGLTALGYRYIPDKPECKGHIEIVPEEADIVKRIYEMCISGMGMLKIATILTQEKIKTNTGNSAWHISSVAKVLHNATYYTGMLPYNHYERVAPDDSRRRKPKNLKNLKTTRRLRDQSQWLYIRIPEIIDEKIYLAAQKQISKNREANPRKRKYEYLFLNGRLRCACGRTMVGYTDNRGTRRYRCNSKTIVNPKPCRGTARADTLEDHVWSVLVDNLNLLRDPSYLKRYIDQKIGRASAETNQTAERLESVIKQIATLERKQQRLLDL